MVSLTLAVLLQPLLLAIGLHEFVLRRVEVDHLVLHGIAICTVGFWILVSIIGFGDAFILAVVFWGSLSIWTLLYRAFWHPLKRFPGPFGAKLSKWWATKNTWTTQWHMHRVHQALQAKHGDYVRTGTCIAVCMSGFQRYSCELSKIATMLTLARTTGNLHIRPSGDRTDTWTFVQVSQRTFL